MTVKRVSDIEQEALNAYNPVYSEWHRKRATQNVALRKKIAELGDTDLVGLIKERDYLEMNYEMAREVQSEWAATSRRIAPAEGSSCDCNICAIGRALNKAAASA